jgi:hypothetical protein
MGSDGVGGLGNAADEKIPRAREMGMQAIMRDAARKALLNQGLWEKTDRSCRVKHIICFYLLCLRSDSPRTAASAGNLWILLRHSCNPPQKLQPTLSFGPCKLTLTGWDFIGTA